MSSQDSTLSNVWWGYSDDHGWVVLDRNIPSNRPGRGEKLIFLRCRDWSRLDEEREKWKPPYYVFEDQYLKTLLRDEFKQAKVKLKEHKQQYGEKKGDFFASIIKELHAGHFKGTGINPPEAVEASFTNRESVCWKCKSNVNNSIDLECVACGWIICGKCGACGCLRQTIRWRPTNTTTREEYEEGLSYGEQSKRDEEFNKIQEDCDVPEDQVVQQPEMPNVVEGAKEFSSFREASQYAKENPGVKISRNNYNDTWMVS